MKTVRIIESNTEYLHFYLWDDVKDEMIKIEEMDDEALDEILKRPEIIKLLLKGLIDFAREIRETVGEDVKAIWERLDRIEAE